MTTEAIHLLEVVKEHRGKEGGGGGTVVDEKLFESIFCKRFETKDIQDTDVRKRGGVHSLRLKRSTYAMNNPIEHHLRMESGTGGMVREGGGAGADFINRFGDGITSIDRLDGIEWDAIRGSSSRRSTRGHVQDA
jgi:hypothetical protein